MNLCNFVAKNGRAQKEIYGFDCSAIRLGDPDAEVANETWDIESAYRTDMNGSNASYDFGLPVLGLAGHDRLPVRSLFFIYSVVTMVKFLTV